MLSNYHIANRSAVQIMLLGQPQFRDRLRESPDLEQLRQRVIATHHLDPMEEEEVGPYILHRLKQVGYAGVPDFTPDAFQALHQATGGVPRILNTLMARVLLNGALEDLRTIDGEAVTAVVEDARAEANSPIATAIVALDSVAEERIAKLEARLNEQEVALRRVLGLLVSWIESDASIPAGSKRTDAA